MKQFQFFVFFVAVSVTVFAFLLFPQVEPTFVAYAQDGDTLLAVAVDEVPTLDGVADEAFWANAVPLEVGVRRGANNGRTTVELKSVYTDEMVYFLVTWEDPTESYLRFPWELQEDGTWLQLRDPENMGGDENVWYEDKFSFIWEINEIEFFADEGCFAMCHRTGEDGDESNKPYGNKFAENEAGLGDIWHWKSVRNLNQAHDQYVDAVRWSEDTPSAGRHSDPSDGGGYSNNVDNSNADATVPMYMLPGDDFPRDGSPGYILASEGVPFDASLFEVGDRIPGIVISQFEGDGGDIAAGWLWEDGVWTLELGRALVTGSEFDVQFDDMAAEYLFGVAPFDNAQVRHAFHNDVLKFGFEQ